MAHNTPTRRASTTALHDMASPPNIPRRPSSVSSRGSPSLGGDRKKRARNLLRDYYGLADGKKSAGDPLDIDSPASFSADAYFSSLSATSSLPDLLRRENELLTEIRELDGERQSLVYNHHHELIEASDTIRKMKSRAEALDASLDSLKASFQSISQLSATLAPSNSTDTSHSIPPARPAPSRPPSANSSGTSSSGLPVVAEHWSNASRGALFTGAALSVRPPGIASFDPLVHLPALLGLPILLRSLLVADRAKADTLWGKWEPAIRSWEDEGVEGVREVGQECREALREGRRSSGGTKEEDFGRA